MQIRLIASLSSGCFHGRQKASIKIAAIPTRSEDVPSGPTLAKRCLPKDVPTVNETIDVSTARQGRRFAPDAIFPVNFYDSCF